MPQNVFQDLNVRDPFVSPSTEFLLYDTKVVVQSFWRLINTQEGEIPNFRAYGLNIKKFSQYPLTQKTIKRIYDYVKGKAEAFESRASVIRADVDIDINRGLVLMNFYIQVNNTTDVIKLPTWTVGVSTV